jgi:hypothetical protein
MKEGVEFKQWGLRYLCFQASFLFCLDSVIEILYDCLKGVADKIVAELKAFSIQGSRLFDFAVTGKSRGIRQGSFGYYFKGGLLWAEISAGKSYWM